MKQCRKCNVDLVEGVNSYSLKRKDYICKSCRSVMTNKNKNWEYKIKGVYGIFDNECLYVGESSRVNGRISTHKTYIRNPLGSRKSMQPLYEQLQQHSNLEFRILEETPNHKEREKYWIDVLQPTYNMY